MQIIKPSHLTVGDTIGIVSPSYPKPDITDAEYLAQFQLGIKVISDLGFRVKEGKNLGRIHWWSGGTPDERAQDINDFYKDPSVRAIIAHDGGGGAIELLDLLDYPAIRNNPKPLVGFSDITNLHLAIFSQASIVGFQGPLSTYNFGKYSEQLTVADRTIEKETLVNFLTSPEYLGQYVARPSWDWWRTGEARGTLFGGNLSMVSSLAGTRYFPSISDIPDIIFYWEVDNITRYHIARSLYQLKYSGFFEHVRGMVIGRTPGIKKSPWGFPNEPNVKEIVMKVIEDCDFPILSGFESGHEGLNLCLPIGVQAKMDSQQNTFSLLEGAVQ